MDETAQFIAHPVLVPDRTRKQALDAIGAALAGLFGDLPAILAGDLAQDGLQREQGMLVGLRASEMGTQLLLDVLPACQPPSYGPASCLDGAGCGMIERLHAVLAFDASLDDEVLDPSSMSHPRSNCTKFLLVPGKSPGNLPGNRTRWLPLADSREFFQENSRENRSLGKCHCSGVSGSDIT